MALKQESAEKREKRLAYYVEYGKKMRLLTGGMSTKDIDLREPFEKIKHFATPKELEDYFFKGTEQRICSTFSCNKKLTITESLCGDKCISCSGKNKFNKTLAVSK